jgi:hypothetical protein
VILNESETLGMLTKLPRQQTQNTLSLLTLMMMMIKFATFFALALVGAAANQVGGSGLRGLTSANEKVAKSLEEPTSLDTMNDTMEMDEFNYQKAVEVFAPSDLQDTDNENERDLSSYCYDYYSGAIRISNHHNAKGTQGTHYHLYEHKSESWCKSFCSSYSWCKAYEYYHHESRCELWKGWYGYYEYQNGFKSYVKKHC